MTENHSVQDVEKSYSDLRLSECIEQCGSAADNSPLSGSLRGDHQSVPHPTSPMASPDPVAMEDSGQSQLAEDRSLCGASSESAVPLQGGAETGSANARTRVVCRGESLTPDTCAVPESSVPDMMSMLKAAGMPDMLSMMSEGGMPAMMKKGMMKGGPLEMARLFNCIIDMSLARADSDESEDEEGSASPKLPCQYCCRYFSNHMALKTHILVAHEQDDSVLNLTQLTISKKGNSFKDGSQRSRKQSWDTAAFASGSSVKTSRQNSGSESMPMCAELAAAESVSVRGVKRGRIESKDLETELETGGASGVQDHTSEENDLTPPSSQLEPSVVSETSGSSGSNQCISDLESQNTPVESASRPNPKRSKTKCVDQKSDDVDGGKYQNEDSTVSMKPCVPVSSKDAVSKKMKREIQNAVTSHKDQSGGNRLSLDTGMDGQGQGPTAAAAAGPSEQAEDSPTSVRRSL